MKVVWLKLALDDLTSHSHWIAQHDPAAALQQVRRVRAACASLGAHPNLGRSGQVAGTRELVIPKTSVTAVYRVTDSSVEILAVMHQRREWPSAFES